MTTSPSKTPAKQFKWVIPSEQNSTFRSGWTSNVKISAPTLPITIATKQYDPKNPNDLLPPLKEGQPPYVITNNFKQLVEFVMQNQKTIKESKETQSVSAQSKTKRIKSDKSNDVQEQFVIAIDHSWSMSSSGNWTDAMKSAMLLSYLLIKNKVLNRNVCLSIYFFDDTCNSYHWVKSLDQVREIFSMPENQPRGGTDFATLIEGVWINHNNPPPRPHRHHKHHNHHHHSSKEAREAVHHSPTKATDDDALIPSKETNGSENHKHHKKHHNHHHSSKKSEESKESTDHSLTKASSPSKETKKSPTPTKETKHHKEAHTRLFIFTDGAPSDKNVEEQTEKIITEIANTINDLKEMFITFFQIDNCDKACEFLHLLDHLDEKGAKRDIVDRVSAFCRGEEDGHIFSHLLRCCASFKDLEFDINDFLTKFK